MNPEQTQVQPQDIPSQTQDPVPQAGSTPHDLTQDDSASALGYISTLSRNHLMQQQAAQESAQQAQQQAPEPQPQEAPPPKEEGSVLKEIKALRKEVQGNDMHAEIESIKKELETLLKEDGKASEN